MQPPDPFSERTCAFATGCPTLLEASPSRTALGFREIHMPAQCIGRNKFCISGIACTTDALHYLPYVLSNLHGTSIQKSDAKKEHRGSCAMHARSLPQNPTGRLYLVRTIQRWPSSAAHRAVKKKRRMKNMTLPGLEPGTFTVISASHACVNVIL